MKRFYIQSLLPSVLCSGCDPNQCALHSFKNRKALKTGLTDEHIPKFIVTSDTVTMVISVKAYSHQV